MGSHRAGLCAFAAFAAVLAVPASATSAARHPLTIGISADPSSASSAGFALMRRAAITRIRVPLEWPAIAPRTEPDNWDPSNPEDPHYDWSTVDSRIRAVVAAGLEPIVAADKAPAWARTDPEFGQRSPPYADKYAQFLRAAAEHFSGTTAGIPRVRYWQIWNEPNISLFLAPQYDSQQKKFTSPDVYRAMVNAAADAIHAARRDNVVIAGETAPFRDITPGIVAVDADWGPLKFMRRLLCVGDNGKPTCNSKVSFDVWSHHPYTSGGPTHHAALPYDVSLGDLPKMRATLTAAARAGHIRSRGRVGFWVTEFSWDSNRPDPCSPPLALLKRWVPEAVYRMWASGVDSVSWFQLMDDPIATSYYQSGLFFRASSLRAAKAKPFIQGLRFPFVALKRGNRVYVWARTPYARRGRVSIQQVLRGSWKNVASVRTDRYGIAQAVLKARPTGSFRAVFGSAREKSLPFSMHVPPDQFFNPFGQPTLLEPNGKSCSG